MGGHVFVDAGLGDVGGCCHCHWVMLVLGNMRDVIDSRAGGCGVVVVVG